MKDIISKTVYEYTQYWQKAFTLKGRSRRMSYWIPYFINIFIIAMMSMTLPFFMSDDMKVRIIGIFSIVTMIPEITVTTRRLHDIGYSIRLYIPMIIIMIVAVIIDTAHIDMTFINDSIALRTVYTIGFIGYTIYSISILLLMLKNSEPGENVYGRNPKSDSTL